MEDPAKVTGPSGRVHVGECYYKVRTAIGGILEIDNQMVGRGEL